MLQFAGILSNGHVALDKVPEFRLEVHSTVKFIVAELIMNSSPHDIHRGLRNAHNSTHVAGDGVVEPAPNALIPDAPGRITALFGRWWGGEVGSKAELADEGIKEASPLIIVGIGEFKDHRNMRLDVHGLEDGSGGRFHRRNIIAQRGGIGGGRGDAGKADSEERIVLHVRHGREGTASSGEDGAAARATVGGGGGR